MPKKDFNTIVNEFIIGVKDLYMKENLKRLLNLGILSFNDTYKIINDVNIDVRDKNTAIWMLGRLDVNVKKTANLLLGILKSNKQELWSESANSLSLLKDKRTINSLFNIMSKDKVVERRMNAAYVLTGMLGVLTNKKLLNFFLKIAADRNENVDLRVQVLEGIAYYLSFKKLKRPLIILRKLLRDRNVKIRFWSVFAVGSAKDKRSLPILKHLAKYDRSICPQFWSINKEARNAVHRIETGDWPEEIFKDRNQRNL